MGLLLGLSLLSGAISIITGFVIDSRPLILLGIFCPTCTFLVLIGYIMLESRDDDYWVIEPSAAHRSDPGEIDPSVPGLEQGPGTCPACGGTLFYGRLNCPHCSASVFASDDASRPPEL